MNQNFNKNQNEIGKIRFLLGNHVGFFFVNQNFANISALTPLNFHSKKASKFQFRVKISSFKSNKKQFFMLLSTKNSNFIFHLKLIR